MKDPQAYQRARRRAAAKLGFYIHLSVYLLVNSLLLWINLRTTPGNWWFLYSVTGWGVGLACHGLFVFSVPVLLDRMTDRELDEDHRGQSR